MAGSTEETDLALNPAAATYSVLPFDDDLTPLCHNIPTCKRASTSYSTGLSCRLNKVMFVTCYKHSNCHCWGSVASGLFLSVILILGQLATDISLLSQLETVGKGFLIRGQGIPKGYGLAYQKFMNPQNMQNDLGQRGPQIVS